MAYPALLRPLEKPPLTIPSVGEARDQRCASGILLARSGPNAARSSAANSSGSSLSVVFLRRGGELGYGTPPTPPLRTPLGLSSWLLSTHCGPTAPLATPFPSSAAASVRLPSASGTSGAATRSVNTAMSLSPRPERAPCGTVPCSVWRRSSPEPSWLTQKHLPADLLTWTTLRTTSRQVAPVSPGTKLFDLRREVVALHLHIRGRLSITGFCFPSSSPV
jgi:hypothetical protein